LNCVCVHACFSDIKQTYNINNEREEEEQQQQLTNTSMDTHLADYLWYEEIYPEISIMMTLYLKDHKTVLIKCK